MILVTLTSIYRPAIRNGVDEIPIMDDSLLVVRPKWFRVHIGGEMGSRVTATYFGQRNTVKFVY